MTFKSTHTSIAIAALAACLIAPAAIAADKAAAATADKSGTAVLSSDRTAYSDRAQMKTWTTEKEQLERDLKVGQTKAFFPKALADRGFVITSVNVDKPDAVEYEVVKGNQTYEVQVDFDKAGKASKVDVTTNMWRHDATKAAMTGKKVPMASAYERGNEAYSDRARMKTWSGEKDRLEKALAPGSDRTHYAAKLKEMGYQVTSVNESEKDYVEYEVVKGTDSFEVQIGLDGAGKAKDVDVTTNVWQTDATERALSAAKR